MRKIIPLVVIALLGLMLVSCADKPFLDVKLTTLSFDAEGGSYALSFSANDVWSAASDVSWCSVSPARGDASDVNEASLNVTCNPNTSFEDRSCTLTITCAGLSHTIQLSQSKNDGILVSQSTYDLTNDAQTISIEVKANVDYAIETGPDWIRQIELKGLTNNTLWFSIEKNPDNTAREGSISFISDKVKQTVLVKQAANQTTEPVDPSAPNFNEGVELMCLIWRLMGEAPEFNQCQIKEVSESADAFFANVKNHEAVILARECYYDAGISYDAVTAFGLHLVISSQGTISFNQDFVEGSCPSLSERWPQEYRQQMLKAVNSFYKESHFHVWYQSWAALRQQAVVSFNKICYVDYDWYNAFFGPADKTKIQIILSFLIGLNNNGLSVKLLNGTLLLSPVFGCARQGHTGDIQYSDILDIIVHEFCHPFCDPLIAKYWGSIESVANAIFERVETQMTFLDYSTPKIMICESFVRSCTIRYLITHRNLDAEKWQSLIAYEESLGFMLVRTLVDVLEKREQQQEQFKSMDDFMPEIIKAINDYQL